MEKDKIKKLQIFCFIIHHNNFQGALVIYHGFCNINRLSQTGQDALCPRYAWRRLHAHGATPSIVPLDPPPLQLLGLLAGCHPLAHGVCLLTAGICGKYCDIFSLGPRAHVHLTERPCLGRETGLYPACAGKENTRQLRITQRNENEQGKLRDYSVSLCGQFFPKGRKTGASPFGR